MAKKKKYTAEEAALIPVSPEGGTLADVLAVFLKTPPMPMEKPGNKKKGRKKKPGRKKNKAVRSKK